MTRLTFALLAGALAFGSHPAAGQDPASGLAALDSLRAQRVSSASKYDQRQIDAAASVSIVTRDEIQALGYQTLDEILKNQIGFYSGNDRQYSDIGVRGLGRPGHYNNRILLLVDGHSLNDDYSGGTRVGSAMAVDLDAVQRVEIVRGPGSSLYGARAMLAVVNLVTRKGRDLDGTVADRKSVV